jgi:hypothetical protein
MATSVATPEPSRASIPQEGLAATHFLFTHAGTTLTQDGATGVEQVAQLLFASAVRLVSKLAPIVLGSKLPQLEKQRLSSGTMTQSELLLHPNVAYLSSNMARIAA